MMMMVMMATATVINDDVDCVVAIYLSVERLDCSQSQALTHFSKTGQSIYTFRRTNQLLDNQSKYLGARSKGWNINLNTLTRALKVGPSI